MNDNNLNNGSFDNKYRATRNMNTAMEAPQLNVNDTLDVNIKNNISNNFAVESNNFNNGNSFSNNIIDPNNNVNTVNNNVDTSVDFNENLMLENNNNLPSNSLSGNMNISVGNYNTTNDIDYNSSSFDEGSISDNNSGRVTYTPTKPTNKKKVSFKITPELQFLIKIVGILLIFILLMPILYDFIKGIELKIFGR